MGVQTIYNVGTSSLTPGNTDSWHCWFGWGKQVVVFQPVPNTPSSALTYGNLRVQTEPDGSGTWFIDITNNGAFPVEYTLTAVFLTVPPPS
jgi:hypothetical protein